MRTSRLMIGVFAVILFAFAIVSPYVSATSSKEGRLALQAKTSKVVIADGGDPLPKPWHKLAA
jgi:hypothetical protein